MAQLDVIDLTLSLCQIPSITGDEAAVVQSLDSLLVALGYEVRRGQVGAKPGRDNLYAALPGARPQVLLTTHIDTVPPHLAPRLSEDAQWLIGRGVCDAKGIAAAMICAAQLLRDEGVDQVGLLFVVGEETSSDGAKEAVKGLVPRVNYLIDGEPTDLKLARVMKGAIVFELEAKGMAGHSAYPESGHSALHQLNADVHTILQHPWPNDPVLGATTVNIGRFEGGVAPNVIAAHASATGVMRTTEDADFLEQTLRSLLTEGTELHVRSKSSPIVFEEVEGFETCVVAFGSDVPHLSSMGKPLLIGPGSIFEAHTAGEKIQVAELREAVQVYRRLCKQLIQEAKS